MFRALTIIAAGTALPSRRRPRPQGCCPRRSGCRGRGTRSGGEVVSDFAKPMPKPAVYDDGLTQGATTPMTVAVRPPVGFIFDLSLVR